MKRLPYLCASLASLALFHTANAAVIGLVDSIDANGTVAGWTYDTNNPSANIEVHFFEGPLTNEIGFTLADNSYPTPGSGPHWFRYTLPEKLRPAHGNNLLYAYGGNMVIGYGQLYCTGTTSPCGYGNLSTIDNSQQHLTSNPGANDDRQVGFTDSGRPVNSGFAPRTLNSAPFRGSPISVTAAPRQAGGVTSVMWDNVEFIDSAAHGGALQYAMIASSQPGETYNPTEAGSKAEDSILWYNHSLVYKTQCNLAGQNLYRMGSSSELQALDYGGGGVIHTISRMAYWIPKWPTGLTPPLASECCGPQNYNANSAFFTTAINPPVMSTTAFPVSSSSPLPPEFDGVETLSPHVLEKTIGIGLGTPATANVLKFSATFKVASAHVPLNGAPAYFRLAVYPDHIRFANVYPYGLASHVLGAALDPNFGGEVSGTTALISVSGSSSDPDDSRYAIGCYKRASADTTIWAQWQGTGAGWATVIQTGVTQLSGNPITKVKVESYVVVGKLGDVKTALNNVPQ